MSFTYPYNNARKLKPNSQDVYLLAVAKPGMMQEAMDQVTDMLRVRRQVPFGSPDNFGMETLLHSSAPFHSITGGIAIAMWCHFFGRVDGRHRGDEHHAGVSD